jgi:soluble lytic murein transglycosylase-like protein
MFTFRKFVIGLTLTLAALPSFATELAVLRNGFSIRHEKRQVIGAVTRLYVDVQGASYVDVPTADIEHFEQAPAQAPASDAHFSVLVQTVSAPAPSASGERQSQVDLKPVDLNQVVSIASGRYRLDPDLVNSVIRAESGFNVRAVSPKGAQGLMQLMPQTASTLGVPNAFDPRANVEGGTRYLRELLERYNFDLVKALAAYNAGPQRVEKYGGVPPYYETRAYVARIVRDFNRKKAVAKLGAQPDPRNSSRNFRQNPQEKKTSVTKRVPTGKSQTSRVEVHAKNSSMQGSQ